MKKPIIIAFISSILVCGSLAGCSSPQYKEPSFKQFHNSVDRDYFVGQYEMRQKAHVSRYFGSSSTYAMIRNVKIEKKTNSKFEYKQINSDGKTIKTIEYSSSKQTLLADSTNQRVTNKAILKNYRFSNNKLNQKTESKTKDVIDYYGELVGFEKYQFIDFVKKESQVVERSSFVSFVTMVDDINARSALYYRTSGMYFLSNSRPDFFMNYYYNSNKGSFFFYVDKNVYTVVYSNDQMNSILQISFDDNMKIAYKKELIPNQNTNNIESSCFEIVISDYDGYIKKQYLKQ